MEQYGQKTTTKKNPTGYNGVPLYLFLFLPYDDQV